MPVEIQVIVVLLAVPILSIEVDDTNPGRILSPLLSHGLSNLGLGHLNGHEQGGYAPGYYHEGSYGGYNQGYNHYHHHYNSE